MNVRLWIITADMWLVIVGRTQVLILMMAQCDSAQSQEPEAAAARLDPAHCYFITYTRAFICVNISFMKNIYFTHPSIEMMSFLWGCIASSVLFSHGWNDYHTRCYRKKWPLPAIPSFHWKRQVYWKSITQLISVTNNKHEASVRLYTQFMFPLHVNHSLSC